MGSFPLILSTEQAFHYNAVIPFAVDGCHHLGLAITTTDRGLAGIDYVEAGHFHETDNEMARHVVHQLHHYFDNPRWRFEVPLDLAGTPFQKRLWQSLCAVPVGQTDTYGHLAHDLNSGAQAVGQACRRNPVPVVVPCHRIVSRQGLGGYAGEVDGEKMRIKKALLAHEGFSVV
jgi:methylated-DNA-[protein]-cysteine S-methyltransferase